MRRAPAAMPSHSAILPRSAATAGARVGAPALLMVAALCGCAVGKDPPAVTAMVEVREGLVYQFGLGQQGCQVPTDQQCKESPGAYGFGIPAVQVKLQPFAFDVHEVTLEQYRYCFEMGVCSEPEGDETSNIREYWAKLASGGGTVANPEFFSHPVVYVSWLQAKEYCAFVGKRLPTEFEWERVAGGPATASANKRVYPFGPVGPRDELGKCGNENLNLYGCSKFDIPRAAMSSTADVVLENGQKVFDLFGNVHEWTLSDGDEEVTCDREQPYDCDDCVKCLNSGKPLAGCQPHCLGCVCGDGPAATKPNCYKPCETPICATVPSSKMPVAVGVPSVWETATRVVRGGSFFIGSGVPETAACEGRSDHRGFMWPQTKAHAAIGIRCARSL